MSQPLILCLSKMKNIFLIYLFFFIVEQTPPEPRDPCNPSPCGANAICNNGVCTCQNEYKGDPYSGCRPECTLNTDCPRDKACVRNHCIDPCPGTCGFNAVCQVINHIPTCSCPDPLTGDPFTSCRQQQKPIGKLLNHFNLLPLLWLLLYYKHWLLIIFFCHNYRTDRSLHTKPLRIKCRLQSPERVGSLFVSARNDQQPTVLSTRVSHISWMYPEGSLYSPEMCWSLSRHLRCKRTLSSNQSWPDMFLFRWIHRRSIYSMPPYARYFLFSY